MVLAAADELDRNECGSESRGSDKTNGRKNKKTKKIKKSERMSVEKRSAEERRRRRRRRRRGRIRITGLKEDKRGKVKKSAKRIA
jgi:hypothetical protein